MEFVSVLLVILILAAIVACAVGIWALREFGLASRSMRELADDAKVRAVPLLEKADVTVDAVNAELLRVDMLVTQFEDAARQVSRATQTISEVANAPERIAGGLADKVRTWRGRKRPERVERDGVIIYDEPPEAGAEDGEASVYVVEEEQLASEDQWQQTESP